MANVPHPESVYRRSETCFRQGKIRRICIQALSYPEVFSHTSEALVKEIRRKRRFPFRFPASLSIRANIERLAKAGVDRVGVAVDAATETLFDRVKGEGSSYSWDNQFRMLAEALAVFGKDPHRFFVGLGETEQEAVQTIQRCIGAGVLPGLFAFTPIRGTALEKNSPPKLESYRRIQLARFLIVKGIGRVDRHVF